MTPIPAMVRSGPLKVKTHHGSIVDILILKIQETDFMTRTGDTYRLIWWQEYI